MAVTFFRGANPLFSPRMRSRASAHPRAQSGCLESIGGFVRDRQNHVSRRDRARHRPCCPRRWIAGPCPGTSQARPLRRLNRATRRPAQSSREPVQARLSARSRDRAPARRIARSLRALPLHHIQRGAAAIRPALQEDRWAMTSRWLRSQLGALGIERPHGLLIDVGAIRIIMGEAVEAVRFAARSKTVRKQCNVAALRPILAPHHVPLRQAARIARRRTGTRHQRATLVDVGRVGPAATVQHDDGGVRAPRLRLEKIGDDFGRAIGARKEHRVGQGEGHLCRQHGKHQEDDKLYRSVSHLQQH